MNLSTNDHSTNFLKDISKAMVGIYKYHLLQNGRYHEFNLSLKCDLNVDVFFLISRGRV